jgi:hypothetical protein
VSNARAVISAAGSVALLALGLIALSTLDGSSLKRSELLDEAVVHQVAASPHASAFALGLDSSAGAATAVAGMSRQAFDVSYSCSVCVCVDLCEGVTLCAYEFVSGWARLFRYLLFHLCFALVLLGSISFH